MSRKIDREFQIRSKYYLKVFELCFFLCVFVSTFRVEKSDKIFTRHLYESEIDHGLYF